MKLFLRLTLIFLLAAPALHAASDCLATTGGVSLTLPAPAGGIVEVGADKRDYFAYMVPDTTRLLCAFVPSGILPGLTSPARGLGRYMLVEVSRRAEAATQEISASDFAEVIASVKQQIGDGTTLAKTAQSSSEEATRKLREMGDSKGISIQQITPLGVIFQSPDAYAVAMASPVTSGGVASQVLNASVLLRVRGRLLFVYLYADGGDEASLNWLKTVAGEWTRQILSYNPPLQ